MSIAGVAGAIGRLIASAPEIMEVDVNPLVARAAGEGVVALDALIVTRESSSRNSVA
jgi:succinyl-CoA synthetase beta subunit